MHRVYKLAHVISFIKPPCLEPLRKDEETSFAHGTYFVDSIMLTDTIVKQGAVFQENTSISLRSSKMQATRKGTFVFFSNTKKGVASDGKSFATPIFSGNEFIWFYF